MVALEGHYWDAEVASLKERGPEMRNPQMLSGYHLGARGWGEMDEAGIDVQVLSRRSRNAATRWRLAVTVRRSERQPSQSIRPGRFKAFAYCPSLNRKRQPTGSSAQKAGPKGAMLMAAYGEKTGRSGTTSASGRSTSAREADVPIYLPGGARQWSRRTTRTASRSFPACSPQRGGFTVEAATWASHGVVRRVRQIPRLKMVLGHLGESLPFSAWRIDMALQRPGNTRTPFRDTFRNHFGSPPAAISRRRRCFAA